MIQEGSRHSTEELAELILAAEDELLVAGCREVPLPWGRLLVDPSHPSIYDVNCIRDARGGFTTVELEAGFARVMAESGCRHRRVASREPATVLRLDAYLLPRSFSRQICVAMAHLGEVRPTPVPRGLELVLVDSDDDRLVDGVCACQDLVRREEPWYSREVSRQMDDLALRQVRRGGAEFLAAVTRRDEVVGSLLLRRAHGLGFIADVGTVPAERGRGVASALVAAATSLAHGADCLAVGLTARRDDDPRRIYERLGYRVVGETVDWLRGP
jgi:GNAT superfamily N-acetyltransferase